MVEVKLKNTPNVQHFTFGDHVRLNENPEKIAEEMVDVIPPISIESLEQLQCADVLLAMCDTKEVTGLEATKVVRIMGHRPLFELRGENYWMSSHVVTVAFSVIKDGQQSVECATIPACYLSHLTVN